MIEGGIVGNAEGYVFQVSPVAGSNDVKIEAYRQKDPAAAGGADIPLPEVTAAVDLSAVPVMIHLWGH